MMANRTAFPGPGGAASTGRMPPPAPRPLTQVPVHRPQASPRFDDGPGPKGARWLLGLGIPLIAGGLTLAMAEALGVGSTAGGAVDWVVLALFALAVTWTTSAALVALLGLRTSYCARAVPPRGWRPLHRTAVLILTCGEPPLPILKRVRELRRDLDAAGLGRRAEIFVLSDTRGAAARSEARAFTALADLRGVWWRQRSENTGRKPGNLADWVSGWGGAYHFMLVLDADSRMSAARIRGMIHRMEQAPGLGLLQAGMRLAVARSRFGGLQRLAGRLHGPGFGRGLAAWTGTEGNYWGHNALMRVDAFAESAARLPRLPGRAPFGGDILSHDFVEAALIRRAGWSVEIDPDTRGSFEDGPQRLAEFHRRDRRWCQGNLQHARLLAAQGLHAASRLHLLAGIFSYLAAPLWLALILTIALGRPDLTGVLPLLGALTLILVPKVAGAAAWLRQARTAARRRVIARAVAVETGLSTLLAPLLLLRQSLAVAAVLAGRDSGWAPAGGARGVQAARPGHLEAQAGLVLLALVLPLAQGWQQIALLVPVLGPLLAAPWLVRWFEQPLRRRRSSRARAPADVSAATARTA